MHDGDFRVILKGGGLLAAVILIIQNFVGFGFVINSSPEKCGTYLAQVNQLTFVWSIFWFPALLCCCTCSFWATCFGVNFLGLQRMDSDLVVSSDLDLPPNNWV